MFFDDENMDTDEEQIMLEADQEMHDEAMESFAIASTRFDEKNYKVASKLILEAIKTRIEMHDPNRDFNQSQLREDYLFLVKVYEALGAEESFRCFSNMHLKKAEMLKLITSCLSAWKALNNVKLIYEWQGFLAEIYAENNQYDEAIKLLIECFSYLDILSKETGDKAAIYENILNCNVALVKCYAASNQIDRAIVIAQIIVKLCELQLQSKGKIKNIDLSSYSLFANGLLKTKLNHNLLQPTNVMVGLPDEQQLFKLTPH